MDQAITFNRSARELFDFMFRMTRAKEKLAQQEAVVPQPVETPSQPTSQPVDTPVEPTSQPTDTPVKSPGTPHHGELALVFLHIISCI